MKEYVSLQAVLDIVMQYCPDDDGSCSRADKDIRDLLDEIEGISAADVQPVKRGTWRKDEQGYDVYAECSECGLNLSLSNYIENEWRETLKYCPCCGARMDGDTNE